MKTSRMLPAVIVVALLTLTGCGAGSPDGASQGSEGTQSSVNTQASTGLSGESIRSALEDDGYVCEEGDFLPTNVTQVISCSGDDGKLIFNKWDDVQKRQKNYEETIPTRCDSLGFDHVWWSTSGDWLMVPAGTSDKQMAAFHSVTESLNFELHDTECA